MKISFDVFAEPNERYRVTLSSGDDTFFVNEDVLSMLGEDVEVVEVDLERISGKQTTSMKSLRLIADGIGRSFIQNTKSILYYYCDDLSEIPAGKTGHYRWPQEYRNALFSLLFKRFAESHPNLSISDYEIKIDEDGRPLYMHLVARKQHDYYIQKLKDYIAVNYGK